MPKKSLSDKRYKLILITLVIALALIVYSIYFVSSQKKDVLVEFSDGSYMINYKNGTFMLKNADNSTAIIIPNKGAEISLQEGVLKVPFNNTTGNSENIIDSFLPLVSAQSNNIVYGLPSFSFVYSGNGAGNVQGSNSLGSSLQQNNGLQIYSTNGAISIASSSSQASANAGNTQSGITIYPANPSQLQSQSAQQQNSQGYVLPGGITIYPANPSQQTQQNSGNTGSVQSNTPGNINVITQYPSQQTGGTGSVQTGANPISTNQVNINYQGSGSNSYLVGNSVLSINNQVTNNVPSVNVVFTVPSSNSNNGNTVISANSNSQQVSVSSNIQIYGANYNNVMTMNSNSGTFSNTMYNLDSNGVRGNVAKQIDISTGWSAQENLPSGQTATYSPSNAVITPAPGSNAPVVTYYPANSNTERGPSDKTLSSSDLSSGNPSSSGVSGNPGFTIISIRHPINGY